MFISNLESSSNYSTNTTIAYKNDLVQFSDYVKGSSVDQWQKLTVDLVQNYVAQLQEKGYASSTIARKVAAVKTFLSYMHTQGHMEQDLSRQIVTPKVRRQAQTLLTEEEVDKLMAVPEQNNNPKNLRNRVLLHLLYGTDLRITEMVELKLPHYDGRKLRFPTNDGGMREIEVPAEPREHLEKYLKEGRPALDKGLQDDALFLNHRGSALSRQGLWLIIKEAAQKANITTAVTPHILRRSSDAHE
jgi:integrase/recombinase XerD